MAASGCSSGLPWKPFLFSTAFTPLPFSVRAITTVGFPVVETAAASASSIASTSWPSIGIAFQPKASARCDVSLEVPADHRLAALPEAVHVEDGREVVELEVRRVLERLPDRALGQLAVPAEHPDARVEALEVLRGERHPDAEGEALAERAGRDVHPGQERRRVPFERARERAVLQHLVLRDHPGGAVDRIEEDRRMALREDEAVVCDALRIREVVAEVAVHENRHEVGGRHRGRGMAGAGRGAHPDRVDAELLTQLAASLGRVHHCHSSFRVSPRRAQGNVETWVVACTSSPATA